MDITKIDKNFETKKSVNFEFDEYDVSKYPFTVYGGFCEPRRKFEKMPVDVAEKISVGVLWGSGCGAGIRITFATDSEKIGLYAKIRDKNLMPHMPFTGSACFSLTEYEGEKSDFIGNFVTDMTEGTSVCDATIQVKGKKLRYYCLHLPLYSGVDDLVLRFDRGSTVSAYKKFENKPKILYYGSSITQGGCASRADNSYQQLVSEWSGFDYKILGFSGSAKAEDGMAEYLKNEDCDLFVCDYDYNAPSAEYLENTHQKLYRAFKSLKKHKNVPVIFLSKPDGLRGDDGEQRFNIIKKTYDDAMSRGEPVALIDGRKIYPDDAYSHCAVDGCHPNDLGFYFMAKAIYKAIKQFL